MNRSSPAYSMDSRFSRWVTVSAQRSPVSGVTVGKLPVTVVTVTAPAICVRPENSPAVPVTLTRSPTAMLTVALPRNTNTASEALPRSRPAPPVPGVWMTNPRNSAVEPCP